MKTYDPGPEFDPVENSEDFHQSSGQPAEEEVPASDAAQGRETSREAFDDLVSAAKEAFRSGSDDARDAALSALPKAREGFNKGLHDLAYGLAYGLTFGSTLAREFAPEAMRNGFSEGSSAGREKAESFVEKQRQAKAERKDRARSSSAPLEDPEDLASPSHGAMRDGDDESGEPVFV